MSFDEILQIGYPFQMRLLTLINDRVQDEQTAVTLGQQILGVSDQASYDKVYNKITSKSLTAKRQETPSDQGHLTGPLVTEQFIEGGIRPRKRAHETTEAGEGSSEKRHRSGSLFPEQLATTESDSGSIVQTSSPNIN